MRDADIAARDRCVDDITLTAVVNESGVHGITRALGIRDRSGQLGLGGTQQGQVPTCEVRGSDVLQLPPRVDSLLALGKRIARDAVLAGPRMLEQERIPPAEAERALRAAFA